MTDQAAFLADVYSDALVAHTQTGAPVSTILAQWADETGWGTSSAWTQGHNYAGVSPGGRVASYPDRATGLGAYIKTLLQPDYTAVRASTDGIAGAAALGASPWAGGHYKNRAGVAGGVLADIITTNDLTRYDFPLGAGGVNAQLIADFPGTDVHIPGTGSGASLPGAGVLNTLGDVLNPSKWQGVLIELALIAGGAALVVLGIWRGAAPHVQPKIDEAKKTATVAAMA